MERALKEEIKEGIKSQTYGSARLILGNGCVSMCRPLIQYSLHQNSHDLHTHTHTPRIHMHLEAQKTPNYQSYPKQKNGNAGGASCLAINYTSRP